MTYIRMTDGRDRGHVREVPFVDAQTMIATGQALAVDVSQPGAMDFKEIPKLVPDHPPSPAPPESRSSVAPVVSRFKKPFKR